MIYFQIVPRTVTHVRMQQPAQHVQLASSTKAPTTFPAPVSCIIYLNEVFFKFPIYWSMPALMSHYDTEIALLFNIFLHSTIQHIQYITTRV